MSRKSSRCETLLNGLYGVSKIIARGAGRKAMLEEILDVLERDLGMIRGTIMLLSSDATELTINAVRNVDPIVPSNARYQKGEGVTGRVLETGEPAVIQRISEEPSFKSRIHKRESTTDVSFICVPIMVENETAGTLAADLPCSTHEVLTENMMVLSIVAGMIANYVKLQRIHKLDREAFEQENYRLRSALRESFRPENIIGSSRPMRDVYTRIHQVAPSETTVVVRGESGTGKELVASAIHYSSPRANGPFVKVNCAALSETLLESELFGHEKGAFTGALYSRTGRIGEADGGTLFLDEIGDFSPNIQVKLLRAIQEREFERVGSNKTLKANVRIIAATNVDLEKAVQEGQFRQDLYYRINVFPLMLPPLRDRKADILELSNHFIEKFSTRMNKYVRRISTPAINMLLSYHWPGNVRELENCIEHAVLLCQDSVVHGHDLPPTLQTPDSTETFGGGNMKQRVNLLEKEMIIDGLKKTRGNISAAARELGITGRMIRYKIDKLGIPYHDLFKKKH